MQAVIAKTQYAGGAAVGGVSGGLGGAGVGGAAGAGIGAIIGGIVGSIVPGPGTALGLQLEQLLVEGSELLQVE